MSNEEFQNLFTIPRTRDGLIKLYVQIVSDKPNYQFDPKRMILDVLPVKADLLKVSIVNQAYPLSRSMADYPKLGIREHRFINFLKFTPLTQTEIDAVFDAYENSQSSLEHRGRSTPSRWEYSISELSQFLHSETGDGIVLPQGVLEARPLISSNEMDMLYNDDVKENKRLRRSMLTDKIHTN